MSSIDGVAPGQPPGGEAPGKAQLTQLSGPSQEIEIVNADDAKNKTTSQDRASTGTLSFRKSGQEKEMELYVQALSGNVYEIKKISKELRDAIAEAKQEAKAEVEAYNAKIGCESKFEFKNMDFKYLTCEVKDINGKTETIYLPLTPSLKQVRNLLDDVISTSSWREMSPQEKSFKGPPILNLLKMMDDFIDLDKLKGEKDSLFEPGKKIELLKENKADLLKEQLDALDKFFTTGAKEIEETIQKKQQKQSELGEKINENESPDKDDQKIYNELTQEIKGLQTKQEELNILKKNQFSLKWDLVFDKSSLANTPTRNAEESVLQLESLIKQVLLGEPDDEKTLEEHKKFIVAVSAMLIPSREEKIDFFRSHGMELGPDTFTEKVLRYIISNEIDPEILDFFSPSERAEVEEKAKKAEPQKPIEKPPESPEIEIEKKQP